MPTGSPRVSGWPSRPSRRGALGPYQLQAAIAALHATAPSYDDTDWPQILALYDMHERVAPGPVVTLNRAVALAMCEGPAAALAVVRDLEQISAAVPEARLLAVKAHLLELDGQVAAARAAYGDAALAAATDAGAAATCSSGATGSP